MTKPKTALLPVDPANPAGMGFDPKFIYELAMRTAPVAEICDAYEITKDQFLNLAMHPAFIKAYNDAVVDVRKEGVSYKKKAQFMSDEFLSDIHRMVKDANTPAAVTADLIKFISRVAGYDSKNVESVGAAGNGFTINIDLGPNPTASTIDSTARQLDT